MQTPLDGLLLVDKPTGPTSHDVVDRIRRCLGQRRVGHAGTLDPMASGLLPLMLGRATRLLRFLPHSPKCYRGTLQLGLVTDTDDATGRTLAEHSGAWPATAAVLHAAKGLLGRSRQVPPAFSARKVGGRRLYELARRGERTEAPAAEIEVFRFDLVPGDRPDSYEFTAEVSRGTYIRGLVRDLGADLGCGGSLASLVRTRIGPLELADAMRLPEEKGAPEDPAVRRRLAGAVVPLERIPLEAATVRLTDADQALRFTQGGFLDRVQETPPGRPVRVLAGSGALLGIGEVSEGMLRPRVVLG
jgi:tRNA pseudouridine55 synthase